MTELCCFRVSGDKDDDRVTRKKEKKNMASFLLCRGQIVGYDTTHNSWSLSDLHIHFYWFIYFQLFRLLFFSTLQHTYLQFFPSLFLSLPSATFPSTATATARATSSLAPVSWCTGAAAAPARDQRRRRLLLRLLLFLSFFSFVYFSKVVARRARVPLRVCRMTFSACVKHVLPTPRQRWI
jgi:hypothetical protein